jgi:hypothetical protein
MPAAQILSVSRTETPLETRCGLLNCDTIVWEAECAVSM